MYSIHESRTLQAGVNRKLYEAMFGCLRRVEMPTIHNLREVFDLVEDKK